MSFFFSTLALLLAVLPVVPAAQAPREARALVTVVDTTGAVLPGATVTLVGLEDATTAQRVAVTASDRGLATVGSLRPGRYLVRAEFGGFETGELADVRLRAGDNKHVVVLELSGVQETVTVGRDAQAAAADPNGGSLTTQLTQDEIASLSDDPDELARQLSDMAGGNAVIKIDSFEGGELPPKAFIRSIRIIRDTFPAENHSADRDGIEIITQAGVGVLRGGFSSRIRDSVLNGRNPFVDVKAPERTQNFDGNLGGTIIPEKSSFSLFFGGRRQWDTPVATYTTAAGKESVLLGRRPNNGWNVQGMVDYSLTKDQILRVQYSQNESSRSNLGVGGFDLAERAYASESGNRQLRLQEAGPIGRRSYLNTRLQLRFRRSQNTPELEAPTIRVLDGVTTGGAQTKGGSRERNAEFSSDFNYVRGNHTVRTGIQLEGRHFRSDDVSNYLGTYVFSSTADFLAGTPRNYTRRIGDPLITYSHLQAALYVQDDLKLRSNLTFSPGLRWEAQTHVRDLSGFAPRLGLTWAPGTDGKTTIRTSYGVFYNWLSTGTYAQTLRVDGFRQQEINIVNPAYPDPGDIGTATPANKYVLGDLKIERWHRFSAAIDRTLTPQVRISMTYSMGRYGNQLRGLNLNAPVNGVRPDPAFANIIQVVPDASSHNYDLTPDININFAGGVRNAAQARWNPRRTVIRFNYRFHRGYNNSDGAFSVPPSGSLADQWSIAPGDVTHRVRGSVSTQALRNLNAQISLNANSGGAYTVTTGFDDNGDSIFNDRPLLTPRSSVRLPWRSTVSANLSYTIPIGAPRAPDGFAGGGPRGGRGGGRAKGITLNLSVNNLTNRANYTGFSGVMTSPYFLQATSVANPRQVDFSLRFSF
ncbi:MAG: carboxypeptidase regulatory-like domain-containing protein [Vicinamibacterales bacterium]